LLARLRLLLIAGDKTIKIFLHAEDRHAPSIQRAHVLEQSFKTSFNISDSGKAQSRKRNARSSMQTSQRRFSLIIFNPISARCLLIISQRDEHFMESG
jgi:hypothetical protein